MVLTENKHYEIIPDKEDEKAWNVRILSGTFTETVFCLLYTSPSPRDWMVSRMPSSA